MSEKAPIPSAEEMRQEHTEKAVAVDLIGELADQGHTHVTKTDKAPMKAEGIDITVPQSAQPSLKEAAEAAQRELEKSDAKAGKIVTQNLDKFSQEARLTMLEEQAKEVYRKVPRLFAMAARGSDYLRDTHKDQPNSWGVHFNEPHRGVLSFAKSDKSKKLHTIVLQGTGEKRKKDESYMVTFSSRADDVAGSPSRQKSGGEYLDFLLDPNGIAFPTIIDNQRKRVREVTSDDLELFMADFNELYDAVRTYKSNESPAFY